VNPNPSWSAAARQDQSLDELKELLRIPRSHPARAQAGHKRAAGGWRRAKGGLTSVTVMPTDGHPVVYADTCRPDRTSQPCCGYYDVQRSTRRVVDQRSVRAGDSGRDLFARGART
jgi:hypothetical protein